MTIQHIPLTEANRRMKQIREFTRREGLVVLTSHDKPALVVVDVDRCLRLLTGMEQLMQLLLAKNLVEAAGHQRRRCDRVKQRPAVDSARTE